jgi:hypothetical protein
MNLNMTQADYPEFLKSDTFTFKVKEVLKDSLYYPGSRTDGEMVRYFRGNFYSFVHVDYSLTKEQLEQDLRERPFTGFKLIYQEDLDPYLLVPRVHEGLRRGSYLKENIPFCKWMIFENEHQERFSLLHISAEGVHAYKQLYVGQGIEAKGIAIIRTDSFSGNWTSFSNEPYLKRVVTLNNIDKPQYLICYVPHRWRDYSIMVEQYYGFTVWEHHGPRESQYRELNFERRLRERRNEM